MTDTRPLYTRRCAAVLEPVYRALSKSAVRKDMWVRIPPAAPDIEPRRPECRAQPSDPAACVDERGLGPGYVYLLGIYLGDGCISRHRRGVYRLRVFQDIRYPQIIARIITSIAEVTGRTAGTQKKPGCLEISNYWKHWPCLLPQHGPGDKHLREIRLEHWQWTLVNEHTASFITGLIHSDGCRAINKVTTRGKRYEYPRYFFANRSEDILELFIVSCALIGVECRRNRRHSISVAKRRSVEILDVFIGPKR
jgi:hypothetical protein